ncbi:hypothetical protein LS684_17880 [Cytobacillus spongiae]|uniref:hypothetical protein n=1 Tax=Cytobacillus spongiae TaxID=2901381 RepID=UPI001F2AFC96|nr:hypothetical protein [Cytobacillus spongiae]UII55480.1 hypothetical protein LS684_17880 [Cytobacillus spongiae]
MDLNDKLNKLSKDLVSLHVKDVLKKRKERGIEVKSLSNDEKQRIKDLVKDLEQSVNSFVQKAKEGKEVTAEDAVKPKTKRTLRELVRQKKNSN